MSFALCNSLCRVDGQTCAAFNSCCGADGICKKRVDDTGVVREIKHEDDQVIVIKTDVRLIDDPYNGGTNTQIHAFDASGVWLFPPVSENSVVSDEMTKVMRACASSGHPDAFLYILDMVTYQAVCLPTYTGKRVTGGVMITCRKHGAIYFPVVRTEI